MELTAQVSDSAMQFYFISSTLLQWSRTTKATLSTFIFFFKFKKPLCSQLQTSNQWVSSVLRPRQHSIGYTGRRFLQVKRPNQQYQSTEGRYRTYPVKMWLRTERSGHLSQANTALSSNNSVKAPNSTAVSNDPFNLNNTANIFVTKYMHNYKQLQ